MSQLIFYSESELSPSSGRAQAEQGARTRTVLARNLHGHVTVVTTGHRHHHRSPSPSPVTVTIIPCHITTTTHPTMTPATTSTRSTLTPTTVKQQPHHSMRPTTMAARYNNNGWGSRQAVSSPPVCFIFIFNCFTNKFLLLGYVYDDDECKTPATWVGWVTMTTMGPNDASGALFGP